jgi:hypothetical protein
MLRPTGSRPVFLGVKPRLGLKTTFLLKSDSCGFVRVLLALVRAAKISSTCHLYLQFYMSAFYIVSCQESGSLRTPIIYSFTCNPSIYVCSIHTKAWRSRSCPISCSSCHNGYLVAWTVVRLTAAKLKPLIFSVSGFTFSYIANHCIFMILCDLCLLPAKFCYVIINIRHLENHVQRAPMCTLEIYQWWGEPYFTSGEISKDGYLQKISLGSGIVVCYTAVAKKLQFLWLPDSYFEKICHNVYIAFR